MCQFEAKNNIRWRTDTDKKIKPRNLENDQSTNIFKVGIIIVSVFQRTSPLHKRK